MKYLLIYLMLILILTTQNVNSRDYINNSGKVTIENQEIYLKNYSFYTLYDTSEWSPEKDLAKYEKKGFGKSGDEDFKAGIGFVMGLGVPYGVLGTRAYLDYSYLQGGGRRHHAH